jgi:CheY-like chemotaxis protein
MIKQRVLIVEDDAWLADQQSKLLEKAGYNTKISAHALAAIHDIDSFKPACILLDVLLTGSTGFALMHELQSYADTGKLPIILCTNLAEDIKLEDMAHYGVKRILDKTTMQPEDVVAAVRSVL